MVLKVVHIPQPMVYSLTKYMCMTKTTTTGFMALLLMVGMLVSATSIHASEVTGTLSSDTANNVQADGNISGTVTSESVSGGSSSGGGRGGGGSSSLNAPSGAVLGATTDTVTPGFPNAGSAPEATTPVSTIWSRIMSFFTIVLSPLY